MNITRVVLAGLGGFVAYFAFGGIAFVLLPSLKTEFAKYPAVYRDQNGIKRTMPMGMAAMLLAIFALAALYAMAYRGGTGAIEGAKFGALVGVFVFGAFVIHNYVNLNIGIKLALQQSVAYFFEWLVTCIAIGLIYRH
jgi:hypothetical protein